MITIDCINNPSRAGGFGNQLFKVCAAIAYALDNNTTVALPEWHFNEYLKIPFENIGITIENFEPIHDNRGQVFVEFPKNKNLNITDDGYFQDLRYFHHHHASIIKRLELKENKKIEFYDLLSSNLPNWQNLRLAFIHVRRGDYHGLEYILPMQSKTYYDYALNLIEYDKCIVLSDELDWCKNTFDYKNLVYLDYSDKYFDMFLMTLCSSGIIANSTFSWFGAYLNPNNPIIVKPKFWFSSISGNNTHDHNKIKLKNWMEV